MIFKDKIRLVTLFIFFLVFLSSFFTSKIYAQTSTPTPVCARTGTACATGVCNSSCVASCPAGYSICDISCNSGAPGSCIVPDMSCSWQYWDGTKTGSNGHCCCPIPTSTSTPVPTSTPIPTSTPAPVCDSTCGAGVCGVRRSDGTCYADWGNMTYGLNCCHMRCVPYNPSGTCQYIVGGGSWDCAVCGALSPTPTLVAATPTPTPCSDYSSIWSFRYTSTIPSWWQTEDGDVYANGSITSLIPDCATTCSTTKYLSKARTGGMHGVVGWNGADPELLDGTLSNFNWQVKSDYYGDTMNFDYLMNKFNVDTTQVLVGSDIPTTNDTYYFGGNLILNGRTVTSGQKIIIFVKGDVLVNRDIIVSSGGFFALIASGNITFSGNDPDIVNTAQGFFLANGAITVASGGATDTNFIGQGNFVAQGGFNFDRNLGPGNQNCCPAEYFSTRPDFYINAPTEFQSLQSFFQEVAP